MTDLSIVTGTLAGGGVERVMVTLANSFAGQGKAVDLVLLRAEGAYRSDVARNVRVVDLQTGRASRAVPALIRYLRRSRSGAVLSGPDHVNLAVLLARRFSGVDSRVVVSVHNARSIASRSASSWRGKALPSVMRATYRRADAVVAVSQGVADDLLNNVGIRASRVIYNPIVTPRLNELASEPPDHPWFTDGGVPVIVAAGRLTRQKGFTQLLDATAMLMRRRSCRLAILGEGEQRDLLRQRAESLGISDAVWMPGFVSNPYRYFARAAVFAMTSEWEGFGNVLVEALATGCPVVSTDCVAGPAEILANGRYGELVPVGDAAELSRALERTMGSPLPRELLMSRARDFAVDVGVGQYSSVLFGGP